MNTGSLALTFLNLQARLRSREQAHARLSGELASVMARLRPTCQADRRPWGGASIPASCGGPRQILARDDSAVATSSSPVRRPNNQRMNTEENPGGLDLLATWAREAEVHPHFRDPQCRAEYSGVRELQHTAVVARDLLRGPEAAWDQIDELAKNLAMELKRRLVQLFKEKEEKREQ